MPKPLEFSLLARDDFKTGDRGRTTAAGVIKVIHPFTGQPERALMVRRDYKVLHNSSRCFSSVHLKPLNTKGDRVNGGEVDDVCDNLSRTARNPLILKTERWPSG